MCIQPICTRPDVDDDRYFKLESIDHALLDDGCDFTFLAVVHVENKFVIAGASCGFCSRAELLPLLMAILIMSAAVPCGTGNRIALNGTLAIVWELMSRR